MRQISVCTAVVFISVLSIGTSACNPLSMIPADERTFRSESGDVIGHLDWEIIDCEHGETISTGSRPILARDITIVRQLYRDGSTTFDKRIDVDQGFYVALAEFPEASADDVSGFGLMSGRGDGDFSWEWFDVDDVSHARKLQESGELRISHVRVGTRWELGQTEFETDVSLRVFDDGSGISQYRPRWRIRVRKGSHIQWPSVTDDMVVAYVDPAPALPN